MICMKQKYIFTGLFVVVALIFAACKNPAKGTEPDIPEKPDPGISVVLNEDTVILDDMTMDKLISFNEQGTMTFTGLPRNEIPVAGNIIVAGLSPETPYGMLRKVTSVTQSGGQTVVYTEPAAITDAVESGEVSASINLDFESYTPGSRNYGAQGRSLIRNNSGLGGVDIPFEMEINDNVKIDGNINIDGTLDIDLKIDWFTMEYLNISFANKSVLEMTLKGEWEGELDEDISLGEIELRPISVLIGGVFPLWVTPVLGLNLNVSAKGTIEGELPLLTGTVNLDAGVRHQNGQTQGYFGTGTNVTRNPDGYLLIEGEAQVTVEPVLSVRLYGNEDITVSIAPGIYGRVEVEGNFTERYGGNPLIRGFVGASVNVAAKLAIFGIDLYDDNYRANVFEVKLYELSLFPQFEPFTFIPTEFNSIMASAAMETPEHFFAMLPVSEYGIYYGTTDPPGPDDINIIEGVALPAPWSSGEPPHVQVNLGLHYLEEGITYYAVPYFIPAWEKLGGTFYGNVSSFTPENPGDFLYRFNADIQGYSVIRYTGTGTNVVVPARYQGYPIKEIGNDGWYFTTTKITSISLPDGLEIIGDGVFSNSHPEYTYENLTYVNIPSTVRHIGPSAFNMCWGISNITIPASVNYVGAMAFSSWFRNQTIHIQGSTANWDNTPTTQSVPNWYGGFTNNPDFEVQIGATVLPVPSWWSYVLEDQN